MEAPTQAAPAAKIIRVDSTPNPNARKFVLDRVVAKSGSLSFNSTDEAKSHLLAAQLFGLPGVISVFIHGDFVAVNKDDATEWEALEEPIIDAIQHHAPSMTQTGRVLSASADDAEMMRRINEVLDKEVRPGLAGDGGGLDVVDLDGCELTVRYQGACGSCPSSTSGTLRFIQDLLTKKVDPKITVTPIL
jgi:Fe-S cluster biogenesis protein NfuA